MQPCNVYLFSGSPVMPYLDIINTIVWSWPETSASRSFPIKGGPHADGESGPNINDADSPSAPRLIHPMGTVEYHAGSKVPSRQVHVLQQLNACLVVALGSMGGAKPSFTCLS